MMNTIESAPSRGAARPRAVLDGSRPLQAGPPAWRLFRSILELQQSGPTGARERAARLGELCRLVCEMHRLEVEVRGKLPETPAIVVANHLGYIDPVVLCSLIPLCPVAKSEIAEWALLGAALERLNVSFVRRGNAWSGARVLLRSLRSLRAGVSVLNFPEGTTSRGSLLPFHLGAFWLSRHTGLPLVPVSMDFEDMWLCWVDREAFLPHYARVWWGSGPRRVRVSVGTPLDPEQYRSVLDLSFAAQTSIASGRAPYASSAVLP
jgi:1-acyl-sn-glycerol-3-phosphate acyltransferase